MLASTCLRGVERVENPPSWTDGAVEEYKRDVDLL
jgi:hypothetical protein